MEFHKSERGRKFFDHDLPVLIMQLKRIAEGLEKQNKINEKLIKIKIYEKKDKKKEEG